MTPEPDDEERREVIAALAGFDPALARRQAKIAPAAHELLASDIPPPSPELHAQLCTAAAEIGLEPKMERRLVLTVAHWYAVLDTPRGEVAAAVVPLGENHDQAWRNAFAQIGLELGD